MEWGEGGRGWEEGRGERMGEERGGKGRGGGKGIRGKTRGGEREGESRERQLLFSDLCVCSFGPIVKINFIL